MCPLICPHCNTPIPLRLDQCFSCMARIKYGAPGIAFVVMAILSLIAGFKAAGIVPDRYSFLGWVAGWFFSVFLFIPGSVFVSRIWRHRVKFIQP